MHKRTKATSITHAVKKLVWLRDLGRCIECGRWAPGEPYFDWSCAHYISRAQGGRGDTPQNILTLCPDCHRRYDEGLNREDLMDKYLEYLEGFYRTLQRHDLIYHKWEE